jgi:hypothetical protein
VEIKAKEIEGQNAEPQQPELSIQIDEVEATPGTFLAHDYLLIL